MQGCPMQRAEACRQIPAALAQKSCSPLLLAAILLVDLDDTLGRLALDMSTHDELQYGLQCYLAVREAAAQQERELKAIKDKQTDAKWQVMSNRHANAGMFGCPSTTLTHVFSMACTMLTKNVGQIIIP